MEHNINGCMQYKHCNVMNVYSVALSHSLWIINFNEFILLTMSPLIIINDGYRISWLLFSVETVYKVLI